MPYADSVALDQPAHQRSPTRELHRALVCGIRFIDSSADSVALRSDRADAQADPEPHRPQKACENCLT